MSAAHIESSTEPQQSLADSNLVDAIRGGDRPALERLYLRYRPRLARLLASCMAPRHKIEDLIDETLLTVWMQAKDFRPSSKVSTWVAGIACSLATQSLSAESHTSAEVADPVRGFELGNGPIAVLIRLPVEQRITMSLAYQFGLSIEEISEVTQCTVETAQIRMFLARMEMREAAAQAHCRQLIR
jgi:DNA-directed RNA polymerase specialized sigma24 family protein